MPLKVFYSYAHEDNKLRGLLEKHLNLLKRQDLIETWHDRNIDAGKEWAREIDTNLNTADIILLLISPDFVYSDYCYSKEMTRALQRHENGTARVIPVILRPGDYEEAPFNKLQALPANAYPVTDRKWHNRDEAFLDIAQGIRAAVKEILSEQWVYNGNLHFYRQQYYEALEAYEKATILDPMNPRAYIGKGKILNEIVSDTSFEKTEKKNFYLATLDAFNIAIDLDPTIAEAYAGKGKTLLGFSPHKWGTKINVDKPMILEAYDKAIQLDPRYEEAYIGKADTFKSFGDNEAALATYEKAIKLMTGVNRTVYNHKADVLYNLERNIEALETYEQVILYFPNHSYAYGGKGNALYKLDQNEDALVAYEKAISLQYDKPFLLYVQKGKVLHQLQRYQEALNAYDQAIKLGQNEDVYRSKYETLKVLADEALKMAQELEKPF